MTPFPTPEPEGDPRLGILPSANDLFKARWRGRLRWATIGAAAIHAALFAGLAHWEWTKLEAGSAPRGSTLRVIRIGSGPPAVPAPVTAREDPEPNSRAPESDGDARTAGADGAERPRLALEELRSGAFPRPTVVVPAPEQQDRRPLVVAERTSDRAGPRVGGEATLGTNGEPGDSLGLYRLSTLRPELAFAAPGSWILVRNPAAVRRFLNERFGRAAPGSSPVGWLSVAIWVDDGGSVEWAEIHRSSGIAQVDAAALELFREVVSFRPARERGVPVSIAAIFQLRYPW